MTTARDRRPILLRSERSAVLLDGSGDIALERESRGASVDWGGVYGQLVRLTGRWTIALSVGDGSFDLPGSLTAASVHGDLFESRHTVGPLEVIQRIAPLASRPGAVRSLTLRSSSGPVRVGLNERFEPYLLPVLVEGLRPVTFTASGSPGRFRVAHRGFALEHLANVDADALRKDDEPWSGAVFSGPVASIGGHRTVELSGEDETVLRFELTGGLERDLARPEPTSPGDPLQESAVLRAENDAWLAATPEMILPDAPDLETAYGLARAALRRLYAEPGDGLSGLVAGYPWYAALWCRDLAWMIPAVAWLGDLDRAVRSVDSVLRFQALRDVPVVGGEVGELPMQIAPGPIFFYGTSDTTLYFPEIARRLRAHGVSDAQVRSWSPALARAIAWGRRRTEPSSGLLRHGGEAAELAAATASLARVRYGIDALDTTIWDSTDRRDHAIDVQVLWLRALRAAEELGVGAESGGEPAGRLADRLETTIRARYPWAAESYLYDSLRGADPVAKLRPNALRAVSAGVFPLGLARSIVERASRPDLSTPWGVRTLSGNDPGFSAQAYHDGQVWPIATAWAADAALAVGLTEVGIGYLETIARAFAAEDGQANECYRGDRAEPFNSCFLLGLSVAPFLTVLFERVWGLELDAAGPSLGVRPNVPSRWTRASLHRLSVAGASVDLDIVGPTLSVRWTGHRPLRVRTWVHETDIEPGGTVSMDWGNADRGRG